MSSAVCPNTNPVTPPETNNETKPIAKSIGVAKRMRAPHNVPNQLKVLTADGTPMTRVRTENATPMRGFIPLTNIWYHQIDFRVAEKPEKVLPQQRRPSAALDKPLRDDQPGRLEETHPVIAIKE